MQLFNFFLKLKSITNIASSPCLNSLLKNSMLTIVQGTESTSTLATLETPSAKNMNSYLKRSIQYTNGNCSSSIKVGSTKVISRYLLPDFCRLLN
jgi:hypothetical protein